MRDDVLTLILAGGRGARLEPLTRDRAKPAVPFGGAYRIVDFIHTYHPNCPPPKFVFAGNQRCGQTLDSIVCPGSIVSGGRVERSILGPRVLIHSYAQVQDSILFDSVDVGRHAKVQRAIIDKGVKIPEGMTIGCDQEADRARGFTVTESGLVVIPKSDGGPVSWTKEKTNGRQRLLS